MSDPSQIEMSQPGTARCACGATLIELLDDSKVKTKCRRCGRVVVVTLKRHESRAAYYGFVWQGVAVASVNAKSEAIAYWLCGVKSRRSKSA